MTLQSHSWTHIRRTTRSEKIHAPGVHHSTLYNSQDMEAASMFIDRGMDKDGVHITEPLKRMKQCHLQQYGWT